LTIYQLQRMLTTASKSQKFQSQNRCSYFEMNLTAVFQDLSGFARDHKAWPGCKQFQFLHAHQRHCNYNNFFFFKKKKPYNWQIYQK
jgi:hypothetical protein